MQLRVIDVMLILWAVRLLAIALLFTVQGAAFAQGVYNPETDPDVVAVRAIFKTSAADLNLATVKVAIDRLIDPSIDSAAVLAQLDTMASEVRATLPMNASHNEAFEALRTYLYRPGPWNSNQPYHYDLDDPLGHNIRNKLLASYIATRKGNCVTMPLLFLVLAQKLGLNVAAAAAPEHVFVMYRDDRGVFYNFEATSGGFKADASYRRDMPMTARALESGIYMRWLNREETAVLMSETLLEHYGQQGQFMRRMVMSNVLLEHDPRNVGVLLHKAAAHGQQAELLYVGRYRSPDELPPMLQNQFGEIQANAAMWRSRAHMLGWKEPDQIAEAQYRQVIQRAKTNVQQER